MNRIRRMFLPLALGCCAGVSAATQAPSGAQLFREHGCTSCHGAEGIHPSARYAPVLRGKPAEYLLERALQIFSGQGTSANAAFMHEQFCIGDRPAEGCDPVPSADELAVIVRWLGGETRPPAKKRTPQGLYATSVQAYHRLQELGDHAVLIDVRTRPEVAFLGMPTLARANIPFMLLDTGSWDEKRSTFKMVPNDRFVARVDALMERLDLHRNDPVYLMCRSGSRSAKAAALLHANGYTQVYTVVDGYEGDKAESGPHKGRRVVNGWKNSGLPWTYRLDKSEMDFH